MQPPRVTGPDTVIEQLGTVLCHRMQRGERGWVVAGAEGLSCPCLVSLFLYAGSHGGLSWSCSREGSCLKAAWGRLFLTASPVKIPAQPSGQAVNPSRVRAGALGGVADAGGEKLFSHPPHSSSHQLYTTEWDGMGWDECSYPINHQARR